MKKYAIIVAGGTGSRMQGDVPKQFMVLSGKPILMHAIQRFFESEADPEIIVVIPKIEIDAWKKRCVDCSFAIPHQVVGGGETRFHSVKNGLNEVKEKSIVAVHDGARPFASKALINRCFIEAEKYGNAVPAIPLNDSMRKVEGNQSEIADRKNFVLIQTPQCFDSEILIKAYQENDQPEFTDDASIVEHSGKMIHLIEGERENIKITYAVDMVIGEAILKAFHSFR